MRLTTFSRDVNKAMRLITLLVALTSLPAMDSVDILLPGVSYHTEWDEPGTPNSFNYGIGLSYTRTLPEVGSWGQLQVGGLVYKDSFNEWGKVGFAGVGVRSPTEVSVELLGGLSMWDGSGMEGSSGSFPIVRPFWYVGVGYQTPQASVFVDLTAANDIYAAWLKICVPVN